MLDLWQSYYRGLAAFAERLSPIGRGPVWRTADLPWLSQVEAHAGDILAELRAYCAAGGMLRGIHQLDPERTAAYGEQRWDMLHLKLYDETFEAADAFPVTMKAAGAVPGAVSIMFSRLPPERHDIPAHADAKNGTLRMHLGLLVPDGLCCIRVGDEVVDWKEGKAFALDASYEHHVQKEADEERIILIVDFLRPVPSWLEGMTYKHYAARDGSFAADYLKKAYRRLETTP